MWFRLRPDIRYSDLGYGLLRCLLPGGRAKVDGAVDGLWAGPEHTLACLSVRTGFDLLLEALALPPGSEILMTALTIPDMVTIVEHHQLVPVPLDISPDTLAPDPDELRRYLTPRTKAVVVTHLFGTRLPVEPVLRLLAGQGILLIEDCAQAFEGCQAYAGHPEADVSMFSFGPIKTSTALGGALFRVKDANLLKRLEEMECRLPVQRRRSFLLRLGKFLLLKLATSPPLWSTIARACLKHGVNYDAVIGKLARGFGGRQGLIPQIRRRPSTPLLALLRRRLMQFDAGALQQRVRNGERLASLLSPRMIPAGAAVPHTSYWLFPLLSGERHRIIAALRQQGFDASQHHTLGVVPTPGGLRGGSNTASWDVLNQLLFVPTGAAMPDRELVRLAECLLKLGRSSGPWESQAAERYFVMRDGVRVRVLEFGLGSKPAANTLLLVPGLATVFASWQHAVQLLSADFRIVYFESREKASSILPDQRARRGVTLNAMALDIQEVVRQTRLDDAPYYTLGSSTGSTLLVEALSRGWIRPKGALLVGPMVRPRIHPVAAFLTSCTPVALKKLALPFYRAYLRAVYVNRTRSPEQYAKYVRAAEEVELPKIARVLWEMTTYDGSDLLASITIPCLLVGASTDRMHDFAESKRIQALLPRASLVDLGSHEAAHSQPLVDAIRAFVAEVENRSSDFSPV